MRLTPSQHRWLKRIQAAPSHTLELTGDGKSQMQLRMRVGLAQHGILVWDYIQGSFGSPAATIRYRLTPHGVETLAKHDLLSIKIQMRRDVREAQRAGVGLAFAKRLEAAAKQK